MLQRARRLLSRGCGPIVRRALLTLCLWPTGTGAWAQDVIVAARYADATTRYAHGVLGDAIEHGTLVIELQDGTERQFVLPESSVFEDTAPRLYDVTGDGRPEVIAVESSQSAGARLVLYSSDGLLAATPYIGTRFRWLAPLGAADLDGDGAVEVAFVDRPHLAKTLRIWRYTTSGLVEIATHAGVTNHRIGERDIAGGLRTCGNVQEMVLASADWSAIVALRLENGAVSSRRIGRDTSRAAFAQAMICDG